MGRILLWTVLLFLNIIFFMSNGSAFTMFWIGASAFALMDAVAEELDRREFLYEKFGLK